MHGMSELTKKLDLLSFAWKIYANMTILASSLNKCNCIRLIYALGLNEPQRKPSKSFKGAGQCIGFKVQLPRTCSDSLGTVTYHG